MITRIHKYAVEWDVEIRTAHTIYLSYRVRFSRPLLFSFYCCTESRFVKRHKTSTERVMQNKINIFEHFGERCFRYGFYWYACICAIRTCVYVCGCVYIFTLLHILEACRFRWIAPWCGFTHLVAHMITSIRYMNLAWNREQAYTSVQWN